MVKRRAAMKRMAHIILLALTLAGASGTAAAHPFTPRGDGTLIDQSEGLAWPQDGGTPTIGSCTGGTMNWDDAFRYVSCLNMNSYLGHDDWRLPSISELRSLVVGGSGAAHYSDWLNSEGFSNMQHWFYFSADTDAGDSGLALGIDMWSKYDGTKVKTNLNRVIPVRDSGDTTNSFGRLSISKTGNGAGTVASYPPGVSCGLDCRENYSGIAVELTATPDLKNLFFGWLGDADCADGVVTMTSNKTCIASFATSRFTDNGDQTMIDNATGVSWPKSAGTPNFGACIGGAMNWDDAFRYVSCLNTVNYLGHNDWRLPDLDELQGLVANGGPAPYSYFYDWLNSLGFSNAQPFYYWSTTTPAPGATEARGVSISIGSVLGLPRSGSYFVWPVRGGVSGGYGRLSISKTGNGSGTVTSSPPGITCGTDCAESYSGTVVTLTPTPAAGYEFDGWSGDADCRDGSVTMTGDLNCTAFFTTPRFADNGDQTMTDSMTGLIWPKAAGTPTDGSCMGGIKVWNDAFSYISCLNANNYLGHGDWRLPSISELSSLVEYGWSSLYFYVADWLMSKGFINVRLDTYWSSSSFASATDNAHIVSMVLGAHNIDDKTTQWYVWPVRGGQAGTFGRLTVTKTGGSATVTSSPPGISCGPDCTESYSGIDVSLDITVDEGSFFVGWSIAGGGGTGNTPSCDVTMNSDKTVVYNVFLCSAWPVMEDRRYQSLTDWITANGSFTSPVTLRLMGGVDLIWDGSIDQDGREMTLSGGYDCNFSVRSAGVTGITGPVEIGRATMTFDGVTVR